MYASEEPSELESTGVSFSESDGKEKKKKKPPKKASARVSAKPVQMDRPGAGAGLEAEGMQNQEAGVPAEPAAVMGKPLSSALSSETENDDVKEVEVGPGPITCLPGCCFSIVAPGEVGIVQRFGGTFHGYQEPGCIPYCTCIDQITHVDLKVRQIHCSTDCKTLDNVTLRVTTVITYKINKFKLKQAVFEINDPEQQMKAYADNIIRSALPSMELDQAYSNKETLCNAIQRELRLSMAPYGYDIYNALVTDLVPDAEVLQAMNAINAAKRKRIAATEQAEAQKIMQVKQAEADAEAKYLSGTGIARMRRALADGVKESMETMTAAGISEKDAMHMMITTQYIDTLKDFANNPKASAIMVPCGPSAVKDLEAQVRDGFIVGRALSPEQQEM